MLQGWQLQWVRGSFLCLRLMSKVDIIGFVSLSLNRVALDGFSGVFCLYLQLLNVSKHPVDRVVDRIDELHAKLDPIASVLGSLRSAAADAGQLRHASRPGSA